MFGRYSLRAFHTNFPLWASVKKSDLAKLRKKTGYSFSNCKKALEENNNDFALAEKWLKDQAQALGWSKATKVEGRATAQGLVGVAVKGNTGVLIEVNCETDFVARNKKFKSFVELSTQTCLSHSLNRSSELSKSILDATYLKGLTSHEGKTLVDHSVITISSVGENIALRRAAVISSSENVYVAGYTHPSPENISAPILTGKYGALIAYTAPSQDEQIQQTAKQICQHVVGMNPEKIGDENTDEPIEVKDEETVMIHQEFLLDPSMTVGQFLNSHGIKIVDFVRFEAGEQENPESAQSADVAKASQAC